VPTTKSISKSFRPSKRKNFAGTEMNVKKSKMSRELTQTIFSVSRKRLNRRLRPANSDRKKMLAKSKGKRSVNRKIAVESRKKNR